MKKVILIFILGLFISVSYQHKAYSQSPAIDVILGIVNYLGGDACLTGGENASRCTLTLKVGAGVSVAGSGGSGDVSIAYSVTCREGSYACCNIEGAKCIDD